ncbi:MAG: hypothetical protein IJ165_08560 [Proteobacteria bacterium]|nr:hypothetical protein [Pseudomonadota bacterium]
MRLNHIAIFVLAVLAVIMGTSCNKAGSEKGLADGTPAPAEQAADAADAQKNADKTGISADAAANENLNGDDHQDAKRGDAPSDQPEDITLPAYTYPEDDPIKAVIADYLIREIGKNYSAADVCIPSISVIGSDESDPNDIRVWGDFWVFQYKLNRDMLETASGGSHPGLMHLKKSANTYTVTRFDVVADGSDNLESAKKIFGDRYDEFHKINSDAEAREKIRRQFISDYVKKNNLSITKVKDFGWDPIDLAK